MSHKYTREVEYLLAFDDHRWDTVTVEVPLSVSDDRESLVYWAEKNLATQARYRTVVLFALYHVSEEDDDDDDAEQPTILQLPPGVQP